MQIRLSPFIRIAGCAVSLLLFIYSVHNLLVMKQRAAGKVIHCMSAFESQLNKSRLNAKMTLYLYREKGSVQISGDYISPSGVHTPVKYVSSIEYQVVDADYHMRFTGNKISLRNGAVKDEFNHLLPFSVTTRNVDYIYQLWQQTDGSHLIRQNGIPLILCRKV